MQHLVTFVLAGFFSCAWPQPSPAEPVRLRLSFQLPINGTLGANLVRFKEAVARDTSDAIAVDIVHGSQALPDRTVAKSVTSGEIEMAAANVVTLADRVKGVDILSLPFLFNSSTFLRAMLDRARRSRKLLDDAILATGARVLMWQPYGTNVFFSTGYPSLGPPDLEVGDDAAGNQAAGRRPHHVGRPGAVLGVGVAEELPVGEFEAGGEAGVIAPPVGRQTRAGGGRGVGGLVVLEAAFGQPTLSPLDAGLLAALRKPLALCCDLGRVAGGADDGEFGLVPCQLEEVP